MNGVKLIGRLTADPVKPATPSGTDVCRMRLAVERVSCAAYLAKGRRVTVHGRLAHSERRTGSGERRERHEMIPQTVQFLGSGLQHLWVFPTEVPDGTWGGGGRIVRLGEIVALATGGRAPLCRVAARAEAAAGGCLKPPGARTRAPATTERIRGWPPRLS